MDTVYRLADQAFARFSQYSIKPGEEIALSSSHDVRKPLTEDELKRLSTQLAELLDSRGMTYEVKVANRGVDGSRYINITLQPSD